jgi:hypothetical protein
MRLRFSIRDLLWLTLVVAVGLAWFVHQRQLRAESVAREQQLQEERDDYLVKWLRVAHRVR